MTARADALEALRVRLSHRAALSTSFRPQDLLRQVAAEELQTAPLLATRALAALRSDCTVETGSDGEVWMMRPGHRRKVLGDSALPSDAFPADSEIGLALAGQGDYAPDALAARIASGTDLARLQVMASALDRAGAAAPGRAHLSALRAMLNHAQAIAQTDMALQAGFFGREDELAAAAAWIAAPQTCPPLTSLHISGLPGIGKSYLLERIVQAARQTSDPIILRLDFDRSGLQISDAHTFFDEISRQLADNLPQAASQMRQLRLESAAEHAALTAQSQTVSLPRSLLEAMGAVVRAQEGRTVLIVLDTLEVLRAKGDTHIRTLFDHLDKLAEFGMPAIAILSAGRGDALDPAPHRIGLPMPLTGLQELAAQKLLGQRRVPPEHWPRILRLTRGNPLQIALAARAVEVGAFDDVGDDADQDLLSGYLYRAILSRVPADLRRVAQEGLIMRWINPAALEEVLAPVLGLTLSPGEAGQLLDLLAAQHWLVSRDENGLRHRPDVRAAFLPLIYHDAREAAAQIDARAAEWFAALDPLSALYHRLQLTRNGAGMPEIPLQLAQAFTGEMLDELPQRAADAVRHARGQRSDYGRSGTGLPTAAEAAPPPAPDPGADFFAAPLGRAVTAEDVEDDWTGILNLEFRVNNTADTRRPAGRDAPIPNDAGLHQNATQGADPPVLAARYDAALRRVVLRRMPAGAVLAPPDDRAVADLRLMLERNELREADHVLANGFFAPVPVDSVAGLLMLVQQWQAGHWATAWTMFDALPAGTLDREAAERPHLNGRVLLEIAAEYATDKVVRRLRDPGIGARLRDVMVQSGPVGLVGSALEIATIAADIASFGGGGADVAAAVLQPWITGGQKDETAEWRYRTDKMRERWSLTLAASDAPPGPAFPGRAVAPLLPQTVPLQRLVARMAESSRPGPLRDDLIALRPALPEAVALFMPGLTGAEAMLSRLTLDPADTIEALSLTGLLAHWLGGYALHANQPDLAALARAAERWRRASHGRWSHGRRPPRDWQGVPVDAETEDLIRRWMTMPAPVDTARRALRIWIDPGGTEPARGAALARQRLISRYRRALAAISGDRDLREGTAAARSLLAADLPGCLAAPLLVLACCGVAPDVALPQQPETSARNGSTPPRDPRQLQRGTGNRIARSGSTVPGNIIHEGIAAMNRYSIQETLGRLESMAASGRYDTAKEAIRRGSPMLAELGMTEANALEALETPPGKLESINVPPGQLEAIVRATGRPPLIVQDGRVMGVGSLGKDFPADIDGKIAKVEPLLGSIGRMEFLNHDLVWGGTGWVIRDDGPAGLLIATNRHVAQFVARRTHRGDGVFLFGPSNTPYGAALDTGEELGGKQDNSRLLVIDKFVYLAEDTAADVALARVKRPAGAQGFVPLDLSDSDGEDEEMVAVVGYPASDPLRNDPGTMQSYFKGVYEVKRFSPGFLRAAAGPTVLSHDCTTLGGNSGSPVISLSSGKVVGLHFAGEFGVGNSAVRTSTLRALLDSVGKSGVIVVPAMPPEAAAGTAGRFEGRLGYDPGFLRTEQVPLPKVADHWGLALAEGAPDANPHVLRYQHFSVLYSGVLKTPVIAALNLDGGQLRVVKSRAGWRKDPRLPADVQLGTADYEAAEIDRGHLVRRAATNWGTQAQAEQADDDSFHYTVCSPQHVDFNRNPGIWLQIEDHVLRHSRTHGFRVNVMVGPILNGSEPPLGTTGASLPLAYFKVLSMLAEDPTGALRLHATGYVLSQGQLIQKWLTDMGRTEGTEGFAFGAFKTFQVRISDIEAETGHDFGPLRAADPLAAAVETEGPGARPYRTLERGEDLVL